MPPWPGWSKVYQDNVACPFVVDDFQPPYGTNFLLLDSWIDDVESAETLWTYLWDYMKSLLTFPCSLGTDAPAWIRPTPAMGLAFGQGHITLTRKKSKYFCYRQRLLSRPEPWPAHHKGSLILGQFLMAYNKTKPVTIVVSTLIR